MSELESELAALKARVAELENAAKPPKPFVSDYVAPSPNRLLDRISMPPSAMADLVRAVPDALVREVARDRFASSPRSMLPDSEQPKHSGPVAGGGSGWRNATPLDVPGGARTQRLIEGLVDVQDARDRAELIAKEARRRLMEAQR